MSMSFLTLQHHLMRYNSTQMIPSQHIRNPQQFHSTSLTTNKWLLIMTSLNTTYHITQVTHRSSLHRTMLSWFTGNFANVMCVYDDKNAKAPADIFFTQSNSDSGMLQHNSLGEKRTWPRELAGRDCAFLFQVTVLCQRIWGRCLSNRVFSWDGRNSCPYSMLAVVCWSIWIGLACAYIWSNKHEMKHAVRSLCAHEY